MTRCKQHLLYIFLAQMNVKKTGSHVSYCALTKTTPFCVTIQPGINGNNAARTEPWRASKRAWETGGEKCSKLCIFYFFGWPPDPFVHSKQQRRWHNVHTVSLGLAVSFMAGDFVQFGRNFLVFVCSWCFWPSDTKTRLIFPRNQPKQTSTHKAAKLITIESPHSCFLNAPVSLWNII